MIEQVFELDNDQLKEINGVNSVNINKLIKAFPKLKVINRGNELKVLGEASDIITFEQKLKLIILHIERFGRINTQDIEQLIGEDIVFKENQNNEDDLILFGREGKAIKARTKNQKKLVSSVLENDMIFAVGPAGTGKTYTAVALAVKALKEKQIRRIILTRPAVEAGENLGFLPGDLRDKLDPYLQPLYDALRDMIPTQKLLTYFEDGTIEIAPLAFMRGRTLDNAYVILDEAQNATQGQLKMFLTRMGKNAKFFITGDLTQVDLPRNQTSGLISSISILKNIPGISVITLDKCDVVRHQLVTKIIEAYEKIEENKTSIK